MRRLLLALGATFLVLLGTGLYQAWRYVPPAGRAWPRGSAHWYDRGFVDGATEIMHRIGAWVFVGLAAAVVVAWILRTRGTGRSKFLAVVVLMVLLLAAVAELITGPGLRWDQLAPRAVTSGAGANPRGVFLPDEAKYVIIGTTELAPSEFSTRVFLHVVLFPVGFVICGGVLWFLAVRDDRRRAAPARSPEPSIGNDEDVHQEPDVTGATT